MIRFLPFFACSLLAAIPVHAAVEDAQAWTAINASVQVSERIVLSLDSQLRFSEGASRLGQYVVRPDIGYKLDKTTTASIGYSYFHNYPVGPAVSDEHRIWQQLAFRIAGDGKGVTLTGRSRLEQRWVEGADGMSWRMRQQLRLTAPLVGKVRGVVWSEAFIALNDTSWGQNSGLDRWRNSAGLSVPLNKSITIDPGYINQWVVRPGQDRVQHIGNVTIAAKF